MNHREEAGLSHKEKKHHANHIKLEEELAPDTSDLGQKATRLASEGVTEDGSCTGMATEDGIVDQDNHTHRANNDIDGHELAEPSSEAEDLIGRINKQRCTIYKSGFNGGLYSLSSSPELELSLRRSDSETKEVDERHILNHSSALPSHGIVVTRSLIPFSHHQLVICQKLKVELILLPGLRHSAEMVKTNSIFLLPNLHMVGSCLMVVLGPVMVPCSSPC